MGLVHFIFYLYYGSNSYVAAVAYLVCGDVVLGHGCVVFFFTGISSEAFIQRLLILVFARFDCWRLIYILFCSLRRGYYTEKFFCSYVEILIQNAGVRSSLIWCRICWVMGLNWCWCSANPVASVLGDLKELNEFNIWLWASYLCILYEVSVDWLLSLHHDVYFFFHNVNTQALPHNHGNQTETRALQRHSHRPIMATRSNYPLLREQNKLYINFQHPKRANTKINNLWMNASLLTPVQKAPHIHEPALRLHIKDTLLLQHKSCYHNINRK